MLKPKEKTSWGAEFTGYNDMMIFVGKTIPWFHRWRNVWKLMFPIGLATHLGSKLIPLLSFLGRVSTCSWSLRKNNILKWCPVSWNGGTSKSSILIGFSSKNHLFWGTPPIYGILNEFMNFCAEVPGILFVLSDDPSNTEIHFSH